MNVKINEKQKSDGRTIDRRANERRPTFDENKFLTNCLFVAFDEIFRWRKIFWDTVVRNSGDHRKVCLLTEIM